MDARKATDISGGLEAAPVYYERQESDHPKAFPRFVVSVEVSIGRVKSVHEWLITCMLSMMICEAKNYNTLARYQK